MAEDTKPVETTEPATQLSETKETKETTDSDSDLIKKLNEQEQRIDAKMKDIQKQQIALNAQQREIKMSGRALMIEQEKQAEETPQDYAKRIMRGKLNDSERA